MFSRVWTRIIIGSYLNCLKAALPSSLAESVLQNVKEKFTVTVDEEMSRQGVLEKQRLWLSLCAVVLHADEAIRDNNNNIMEEESSDNHHHKLLSSSPAARQQLLAETMNDMFLNKLQMSLIMLQLRMKGKTAEVQLKDQMSPKECQSIENQYGGLITTESRQPSTMIVTRCGFYDFFVRHNRADLTTVMCLADTTGWMRVLAEDPRSKIYCRRPSTISTGGNCCIFEMMAKPTTDGVGIVDIEDIVPQSLFYKATTTQKTTMVS